jgi:hypothetical protein
MNLSVWEIGMCRMIVLRGQVCRPCNFGELHQIGVQRRFFCGMSLSCHNYLVKLGKSLYFLKAAYAVSRIIQVP